MDMMSGLDVFYGIKVFLPFYDPPSKTAEILEGDGRIEWPSGDCGAHTLMKRGKAFHPDICDFANGPPDDALDIESIEFAFFDAACKILGIRTETECSFSDWNACPVRLHVHRDDGLFVASRWVREPSMDAYVYLSYSMTNVDLQRAGYRETEHTPIASPKEEDVKLAERVIDALSLFRMGDFGFHALAF